MSYLVTICRVGFLGFFNLAALALVQPALADTSQLLLRGTSDAVEGTVDVEILVNPDSIATAFQTVTVSSTQAHNIKDISRGIVLMNYQGRDVATLKSSDFDPAHGGTLEITYLRNGINNTYKKQAIELVRNGDHWMLMVNDQAGHHVVTTGFFKAYKVFGQIVGIDSITLR